MIAHFSTISGLAGGRLGHGGGQIGVMLFFLISGFLMGRLYLGEIPDLKSVTIFAQRRIARVFPLFLFVGGSGSLYFEKHPMQNVYLATVLFLSAITGLAWLSFCLIEKPARNAINGITPMSDDGPTMPPAFVREAQ